MTYELKLSVAEAQKILYPTQWRDMRISEEERNRSHFKDYVVDFITETKITFSMECLIHEPGNGDYTKLLFIPSNNLEYWERLYIHINSIILQFNNKEEALLFKMSCL